MDPPTTLSAPEGAPIAGYQIVVKTIAKGCRTTLHAPSKGGSSVTSHRWHGVPDCVVCAGASFVCYSLTCDRWQPFIGLWNVNIQVACWRGRVYEKDDVAESAILHTVVLRKMLTWPKHTCWDCSWRSVTGAFPSKILTWHADVVADVRLCWLAGVVLVVGQIWIKWWGHVAGLDWVARFEFAGCDSCGRTESLRLWGDAV